MKTRNFLLFILILSVFLFLYSLLLKNSYSYLDPDFGWHLKVGEDILIEKDAPRVNKYNYTLDNKPWINHEWLLDYIVFLIYDNFSYFLLHVFFISLVLISLILSLFSAFLNINYKKVFYISLPFLIFGVYTSLPHFGIRLQQIALLFLAIILLLLNYYSKTKNWKILLFFPLLFFLWANLHGSYTLGLGLLLAWLLYQSLFSLKIFEKILSFLNLEIKKVLNKKTIYFFLLIFIVSILVTLINPYGISLYSSLLEYSDTYYLNNISEWLSQFSFPFNYNQLAYLVASLSLILVYFYEKREKKERIEFWSIFIFFFFYLLAFKSRRHFPLFVISSLPVLIEIIYFLSKEYNKIRLKRYFINIITIIFTIIILIYSYKNLNNINWHSDPFDYFCRSYPCEAVKYLKSRPELLELNIYNNYGWGGYLIWLYEERSLFIDGRMPHYPYEDITILKEYNKFSSDNEEQINKLIDKHNIELFLIRSKLRELRVANWEKNYFMIKEDDIEKKYLLRNYLDNSPEWENIYEDNVAVIYILNK